MPYPFRINYFINFIKTYLLFGFFITFFGNFLNAQNSGQDYNPPSETVSKVIALSDSVTYFESDNQDKSILFAYKVLNQSSGLTEEDFNLHHQDLCNSIVNSIYTIALSEYNEGNIEKALELFNQGIDFSRNRNYKAGTAKMLNSIGYILLYNDNPYASFDYFQDALSIAIAIKDSSSIAEYLNSVAVYYNNMGDPECTLTEDECLEQGAEKALTYYQECLQICRNLRDSFGIAQMYNNMAYVYRNREDFDLAEENYLKSLSIREQMKDSAAIAWSYINIGNFYEMTGNTDKADQFSRKAYAMAESLGHTKKIRDAAKLILSVSLKKKDFERAYEYSEIFHSMNDSLVNLENRTLARNQSLQYEYENKKQLDQLETERKIELEKKTQENQRVIIYGVAILLFLVVSFLIFIFNRLRITQKQKNIIEDQRNHLDSSRNELALKNKEIIDSIKYAERIQKAILPSETKIRERFGENIFIYYQPKDVVAGDFYWLQETAHGTLFAVADCTGHGVPGAMVSVICNNALNRSVREYQLTKPNEILDKTRSIVIAEFDKSENDVKDGMDLSLALIQENNLYWSGANNPLWIFRNGNLIELTPDKQPIGKFDHSKPFTLRTMTLEKGDMLYMFTDGYADQFGGTVNKKFKKANLVRLCRDIHLENPEKQKQTLKTTINKWMEGQEQVDDICILGLRI